MKKVLAFVLAVVMVMGMAIPAAADDTSPVDLMYILTEGSGEKAKVYSPEEVKNLLAEDNQKLMAEASEKLEEACPDGFEIKFFFSLELLGTEDSLIFEPIEHVEIVFMQYIDGAWAEREIVINEDKTITCYGAAEGPFAIFVSGVVSSVSGGNAALPSPGASAGDLLPGLVEDMEMIVKLHTPEEVQKLLSESIQKLMAEAKEKLKEACPEGFAVKFFFYVEIIGSEGPVSVNFEAIDHEEIAFMQYAGGEWVECEFSTSGDGAFTVNGIVEAPFAIFVK